MTRYLLQYDGEYQQVESVPILGIGETIWRLKPLDDRVGRDPYTITPLDYAAFKIVARSTIPMELPGGGFDNVAILTLERIIPDAERPVTLGG